MATRWQSEQNGVVADFVIDNGVLHKRLINPNRDQVLRQNQERKRNTTRSLDWGKQVAEIPVSELVVLRQFFGEALFNPSHDKWDRRIARDLFLKSPASDPYRVEYRKRTCRHT